MHKGISIQCSANFSFTDDSLLGICNFGIVKQEKQESVCLFLLLKLMRLI